jgi:hypothetical protein
MPSGVGIESRLFSFPQPTSGAGSLGVYKAFNEDELKEGVERVLNDMAHIAYLSSNPGTQQEAPMVVYVTRKVYPGTQQEAPMVVYVTRKVYRRVAVSVHPVSGIEFHVIAKRASLPIQSSRACTCGWV